MLKKKALKFETRTRRNANLIKKILKKNKILET